MLRTALAFVAMLLATSVTVADNHQAPKKLKALIVDGQNNHNWRATTPILKRALLFSSRFTVDVATSPPRDTKGFAPDFSKYDVIVSNYNGRDWPKATQKALEKFMSEGGGLVVVHAADNSFPKWPAYNEMIGVGG
ncbi:MAG: ThuA domain-containing protein, partial [Planctomycetota bacterium]